jgi:hypothetical protein
MVSIPASTTTAPWAQDGSITVAMTQAGDATDQIIQSIELLFPRQWWMHSCWQCTIFTVHVHLLEAIFPSSSIFYVFSCLDILTFSLSSPIQLGNPLVLSQYYFSCRCFSSYHEQLGNYQSSPSQRIALHLIFGPILWEGGHLAATVCFWLVLTCKPTNSLAKLSLLGVPSLA